VDLQDSSSEGEYLCFANIIAEVCMLAIKKSIQFGLWKTLLNMKPLEPMDQSLSTISIDPFPDVCVFPSFLVTLLWNHALKFSGALPRVLGAPTTRGQYKGVLEAKSEFNHQQSFLYWLIHHPQARVSLPGVYYSKHLDTIGRVHPKGGFNLWSASFIAGDDCCWSLILQCLVHCTSYI